MKSLISFGIFSLLLASSLSAQMKSWTDEKGVTHYEIVGPEKPDQRRPPQTPIRPPLPDKATEDKPGPTTKEDWRRMFAGEMLKSGHKIKYPELQRVKLHVVFTLTMCQSTERTASLMVGISSADEILEVSRSAGRCAREAVETFTPRFRKSQTELASRPSALPKLKSYAAAYLAVMGRIPRAELNSRALDNLQREDQRMLEDKLAELDIELL